MCSSQEISKLQKVQLEILKEFKRVCCNNDIHFYLGYGTCLGAVRHQGFIPWDDDIDILMIIDDYKKLESLASHAFGNEYFLQNNQTDPNYGLPIFRLRKNTTTLIEKEDLNRDIHHGVYIDIYPLYNAPKVKTDQKILKYKALLYRLFLYNEPPKNKGRILTSISNSVLRITPNFLKIRTVSKIKNELFNLPSTGLFTTYYGNDASIIYDSKIFGNPKDIDFEDDIYPIPNDSELFLSKVYGDYMKLPPKHKRVMHHDYVFMDLENSYINYKYIKYLK